MLCTQGYTSNEFREDQVHNLPSPNRNKMSERLLLLKKSNKISEKTYKLLRSSDGLAPRLHGLPKIHKEGVFLRPIVSFVNSPTYNVSRYLARVLSPVVGNMHNTVKNSQHFAEFI